MDNQMDFEMDIPGEKTSVVHKEPLVWIKEIRVYRDWTENDLLRQISLRKGLNVVWSHSLEEEKDDGGVSGHSAGKTTFCRFLRFLLGEETFGNDDLRERIREKLPKGWVAGEVVVDGIPWLVRRHFGLGPRRDGAIPNKNIDSVMAVEFPTGSYLGFLSAIQKAFETQVPRIPLPEKAGNLLWDTVFPWLSRDQECRFDKLTAWRQSSSESHTLEHNVAVNSFIMRAVLGLVDDKETPIRQQHEKMLEEYKESGNNIMRLEHAVQRMTERLNGSLKISELSGLETLAWDDRCNKLRNSAKKLREKMETLPEKTSYDEADKNFQISIRKRTEIAEKLKRQVSLLEKDSQCYAESTNKHRQENTTQVLTAGEHAAIGRCDVPLHIARNHGCELAKGQTQDIESQRLLKEIGDEREHWRLQVERQTKIVNQYKEDLEVAEKEEQSNSGARLRAWQLLNSATEDMQRKIAQMENLARHIDECSGDLQLLEQLRKDLVSLNRKIDESTDKLAKLRKENARFQRKFTNIYQNILSQILGAGIEAEIAFHANRIDINLKYHGDLNSLTIDIIKIIVFDYAALMASQNGIGGHPRFLIHDSPKEADMDNIVYARLFNIFKELEDKHSESPAFQYIVTTTSQPPKEIQDQPCLVYNLDACKGATRFLGMDL